MKPASVEFSRPIDLVRVPATGSTEAIAATALECAAVAKRLDVPGLRSLVASLRVEPWRRKGAKVTGSLRAELAQTCVVSLDEFDVTVEEPVERFYLPADMAKGIGPEDETDVAVNGVIDLGELVAETLALSLDPYPRKPGAVFLADGEAGSASDA